MKIVITDHAKKRLRALRQEKITPADIVNSSLQIPGFIPTATRFRGFLAESGRVFDLVVKDIPGGRLVITVIGK
ncbi:MAG: hypothetical protein HPY81_00690 [Firmicutes bacterium]|nr:hypothetical protein [Bacillota bacterium]